MKVCDYEKLKKSYCDLLKKYGINGMTSLCRELYEQHKEIISLDGVTTYVEYEYRKAYTNFTRTDAVIQEKFDILFNKWNTTNATVIEIANEHNIIATVLLRSFALYMAKDLNRPEENVVQWFKEDIDNPCPFKKLSLEINTMSYCDPFSGHIRIYQDKIRGKVCENYVRDYLDEHKIAHLDEERIRQEGYPVTPDFVFELPMLLIRYRTGKVVLYRNHFINFPNDLTKDDEVVIVSWLECKGMFATEECHKEYYRRQYNSYISCFGEGIVFYHHGFVESDVQDKKVICIDKMPEIRSFQAKEDALKSDINPFVVARYKEEF